MCKNTKTVTKGSGLLECEAVSVSSSRRFEGKVCPHTRGQSICLSYCLTRQLKEPRTFETPRTAYRHGVTPRKVCIFSSSAASCVQMSFRTALRSVRHLGFWCFIAKCGVLAMICYLAATDVCLVSMWYCCHSPQDIAENWTKNMSFGHERLDISCVLELQRRNGFMIRIRGWQCTCLWSIHP
jgi:hypothetical protein